MAWRDLNGQAVVLELDLRTGRSYGLRSRDMRGRGVACLLRGTTGRQRGQTQDADARTCGHLRGDKRAQTLD